METIVALIEIARSYKRRSYWAVANEVERNDERKSYFLYINRLYSLKSKVESLWKEFNILS
jgi:cob(I)alamin adenosyltransferase